jgi:hypothetical protein
MIPMKQKSPFEVSFATVSSRGRGGTEVDDFLTTAEPTGRLSEPVAWCGCVRGKQGGRPWAQSQR